jgi:aminoglycoside phosphotransferase (APT) family kinase protein
VTHFEVENMVERRRMLVESILAHERLPSVGLWCVRTGENEVWLTDEHAVRLSSGRFPGAYAHEARVVEVLSGSVPVAAVLANGEAEGTEWILSRRVRGSSLARAWPTLDEFARRRAGVELGSIIRAMHATPTPPDLDNPWLARAFAEESLVKDAYHAPPWIHQRLLSAASELVGVDSATLSEIGDYITSRLPCFHPQEKKVLTHCDLHFDNLLWAEDTVTAVLDFEGSRLAPPDQELDTIVRFVQTPTDYVAGPNGREISSSQLRGVFGDIATAYPELLAGPTLVPRLEVYEVMWFLTQLLHFPPTRYEHGPWERLCGILREGSCVADAVRR